MTSVLIELSEQEYAELNAVKDACGFSWKELLLTCRGTATAERVNAQMAAFFTHLDKATTELEARIRKDEAQQTKQPGVT